MAKRPGPGGFVWDEASGRYRSPNGRYVPRATIRRAIDTAIDNAGKRMRATSEQLRQGTISLDAWHLAMRSEVKNVHIYSRAAAKGGWAQLSQADYGAVGNATRRQYAYLDRLAGELAAETQALDGRFLRRTDMYAQTGRAFFEKSVAQDLAVRGFDEQRSILHPADHCGECEGEAAAGWRPVGVMIPIGERECLTGCRCSSEMRNSATGEIAA